jgi:hypothetical protein
MLLSLLQGFLQAATSSFAAVHLTGAKHDARVLRYTARRHAATLKHNNSRNTVAAGPAAARTTLLTNKNGVQAQGVRHAWLQDLLAAAIRGDQFQKNHSTQ